MFSEGFPRFDPKKPGETPPSPKPIHDQHGNEIPSVPENALVSKNFPKLSGLPGFSKGDQDRKNNSLATGRDSEFPADRDAGSNKGNPPSNRAWNPASDPHPAVLRIITFEQSTHSNSFGSGTYIGNEGEYGMVLTNWHVVRDCEGLVQVHFPSGFASYAAVLTKDETWDLALLLISQPRNCPAVEIANTTPRIGDPLWIAGYGSGNYRLINGRCCRYISPLGNNIFDFVDVSVEAREGDSGGPIFNVEGELAGVLFGSDSQNTAGSYCGRVRSFLEVSRPRFSNIPAKPESFFATIEPQSPTHTLREGAAIFKEQVQRSLEKETAHTARWSSPRPPLGGNASSTARASRLVNPQSRSSSGSVAFYPNFPPFETAAKSYYENEKQRGEKGGTLIRGSEKTQNGFPASSGTRTGHNQGVPSQGNFSDRNRDFTSGMVSSESSVYVDPRNPNNANSRPNPRGTLNEGRISITGTVSSETPSHARISSSSMRRNAGSASTPQSPHGREISADARNYSSSTSGISEQSSARSTPATAFPSQSQQRGEFDFSVDWDAAPVFSEVNEPYAHSTGPGGGVLGNEFIDKSLSESIPPKKEKSGSFFQTLKIIALIFVVFFVIFHLVKLMSIIEENENSRESA